MLMLMHYYDFWRQSVLFALPIKYLIRYQLKNKYLLIIFKRIVSIIYEWIFFFVNCNILQSWYSCRVVKVGFGSGSSYLGQAWVSKKSRFPHLILQGFPIKIKQNSGQVGVWVPFFRVGMGPGIIKLSFRVPDYITSSTDNSLGKILDWYMGSCTNHVAIFSRILTPPPPFIDKHVHFQDPP